MTTTMRLTTMTGRVLAGMMLAFLALPVAAQEATELVFSDVTTADVPRSRAMTEIFAEEIGDGFAFKPYFGGTLMKQGSELVALQRGNLDLAILPPSDFATQLPAFDILGAAYVVRDAEHLHRIFDSKVGTYFRDLARAELGVEIIAPAYYGTRQVNIRGDRRIETPADMLGIKLRMPGGVSWQFLGAAIGADPVPLDYAEVYTGLQTGVIDGQDNPLPNDRAMKFYEVTDQIVLTGHNVGFGLLVMSGETWDSLEDSGRDSIVAAARSAFEWSDAQYLAQEAELAAFFEGEGLDVYTPDVAAFRSFAQDAYLGSELSASWPVARGNARYDQRTVVIAISGRTGPAGVRTGSRTKNMDKGGTTP